jgi:hypothetical protein
LKPPEKLPPTSIRRIYPSLQILINEPISPAMYREFRADPQALRGLAALLAVLYHADFGLFPAGYLGVDIFFVISG